MRKYLSALIIFFTGISFVSPAKENNEPPLGFTMPAAWSSQPDTAVTDGVCPQQWWQSFGDTLLDSLVTVAVENNYDAAMAAGRIAMARATLGSARAAYSPRINASASYTRDKSYGLMAGRTSTSTTVSYFGASLSANWEIDLFGKITAQVKAARGELALSRAERAAVELSVCAETASAYIGLRVHQACLSVAREHAAAQLKVLNIARTRFETGLASMMDVDQAEQVYYSTIASIPPLEISVHADINAIALLLGVPGDSIAPALATTNRLPSYRQIICADVPSALLSRRPDVAQAQKQVEVCAAKLGIAKKEWLPTLSVSASAGTAAHDARDLFSRHSFGYTVAPTLSWTVFDGLARRYNIVSQREELKNAVDSYNLTVLTAVNEVDNAINSYINTVKYIDALDKVVKSSENYDRRAVDNYKSGLSPFINVADAQISFLENINALITAKGDALNSLVSIYKSLGGGWDSDQADL